MSSALLRRLVLPLVVLACLGLPLTWAFPENLGFWRAAGIVCGWLGCGLLLACLLLMLREPRLAELLGGLERMYRWHHRLGVVAYLLLLAHPLALAAAQWQEHPTLAWALLAPLQKNWPVWSGWAALLCMMTGLFIALMPSAGLRYARWRGLHGLLALAVILGALHLLLLGVDTTPLLVLPLLALGLLLWRVLRADYGLAARPYLVERVAPLAADAIEATLQPLPAAPPAAGQAARPGQFVLVAFLDGPGFHGCGEYHPFTVSAIGADGRLALGIKALGDCTRTLQGLHPGVAARVQGPFGAFLPQRVAGPSLWLAGGIGITPFMAALRDGPLAAPVRLVYLHRDAADAAYVDELRTLAQQQPTLTLSVLASGAKLPDLERLLPQAAQLAGHECYLCGPHGLVEATRHILAQRGVAAAQIHFERFDFR